MLPLSLLLLPLKSSFSVHSLAPGLLAQDELVLVEQSTDAGDLVQIVYRNGGLVDANALESLCDKVLHAFIGFSYGALYLAVASSPGNVCAVMLHVRCRWDGPAGH